MTEPTGLLLLSSKNWPQNLLLASIMLTKEKEEVFFVDPENTTSELAALKLLSARLPLEITDATGDAAFSEALHKEQELKLKSLPTGFADTGAASFLKTGEAPPGLVCAPAKTPSLCIKAAVLAVRLGYYFIPCYDEQEIKVESLLHPCKFLQGAAEASKTPLIWLGAEEEAKKHLAQTSARPVILPGDDSLLAFMKEQGLETGYLLLYNSQDLEKKSAAPSSPGQLWVKGLSLLAPLVASYRPVFPFDVLSNEPDPARIEKELNSFAHRHGLSPDYMVLLASPGAIPLIYEPQRTIDSTTEEMARDIHLRLNDDIFFDVAEGRLFQSSPGGLSTQILSTKHFHQLTGTKNASKKMLVAVSPEVDYKIIFNSDDPLIESQLTPHLEGCGHKVTILEGQEAHHESIAQALQKSDFFLYAGHGTTEALKTYGRFLTRRDLLPLPPLVAFASACTTAGMAPYWVSDSDGLSWQEIPVPYRDQFGLAMTEKGAICFVGGSTSEDLQFATSMYPLFFEAILVEGLSVGEALRKARNFVSLYSAILQQKAPETYGIYKWWFANTLQQQTLLGDPALVPAPQKNTAKKILPEITKKGEKSFLINLKIPEKRWRRVRKAVHPTEVTQAYYRTRNVELDSPYGEGIVSWGDFYRVAPDAKDSAELGVMSSFAHLYLDLPSSLMPLHLQLKEVKGFDSRCLVCGQESGLPREIKDMFEDSQVPFIMMGPVRFDYRKGWAFAVEERQEGHRVHWLAPLLALDDSAKTSVRAAEFTFELTAGEAKTYSGQIKRAGSAEENSYFVSLGTLKNEAASGKKGQRLENVLAQAVTNAAGTFKIKCAAAAAAAEVDGQFPLYEILAPYQALEKEACVLPAGQDLILKPGEAKTGQVKGRVVDSATAKPLQGALVRAWRAVVDPSDYLMTEGFAGEACTDEEGGFTFNLAAGKYQLFAVAQAGDLNYKAKQVALDCYGGEEHFVVLALEAGAKVEGRIHFEGEKPLYPVMVCLKNFRDGVPAGTLASVYAGREGYFSCLVAAKDRFCLEIREEGYELVLDTSNKQGFKLKPGETLKLSYTLKSKTSGRAENT